MSLGIGSIKTYTSLKPGPTGISIRDSQRNEIGLDIMDIL
jgi:hypothetical protein